MEPDPRRGAPGIPRCERMVLGSPATAPPSARLTLWLLLAVPPPPTRRPGTDSSSLSEGTCGTNKERCWPKGRGTPGAAGGRCGGNPAAGKQRDAPGWGGGERGEEGRGPRGGDSAPPPPGGELGGPRGSRAHEGRGSAPPPAASQLLGSFPAGFVPGRSGISVPPPGAARVPGASAAAGSASPAPPCRGRAGRG